jgi:hypothetical protein
LAQIFKHWILIPFFGYRGQLGETVPQNQTPIRFISHKSATAYVDASETNHSETMLVRRSSRIYHKSNGSSTKAKHPLPAWVKGTIDPRRSVRLGAALGSAVFATAPLSPMPTTRRTPLAAEDQGTVGVTPVASTSPSSNSNMEEGDTDSDATIPYIPATPDRRRMEMERGRVDTDEDYWVTTDEEGD